MTKLTTHCLDTFSGKPARGVKVDIYFVSGKREKLNSIVLNNDGRTDKPLVEGNSFREGQYELVFFVGDYFKKITTLPKILFLPLMAIIKGKPNFCLYFLFKSLNSLNSSSEH